MVSKTVTTTDTAEKAEGRDARLADIAAEFVRLKVNVIVTSATPRLAPFRTKAAPAARTHTTHHTRSRAHHCTKKPCPTTKATANKTTQ